MFAVTLTDNFGINFAKSYKTKASAKRKYNSLRKSLLEIKNPRLNYTLVLSSSDNFALKSFRI